MPLGAGFLRWVLACRTIEKKTKGKLLAGRLPDNNLLLAERFLDNNFILIKNHQFCKVISDKISIERLTKTIYLYKRCQMGWEVYFDNSLRNYLQVSSGKYGDTFPVLLSQYLPMPLLAS